jgi:hypothetical protein
VVLADLEVEAAEVEAAEVVVHLGRVLAAGVEEVGAVRRRQGEAAGEVVVVRLLVVDSVELEVVVDPVAELWEFDLVADRRRRRRRRHHREVRPVGRFEDEG